MKRILLFILLTFAIFSSIKAQSEYDVKCAELINKSRWFELNEYYNLNVDSLGEFMQLCAGGLIGNYFNKPEDAIRNLEVFTDKYAEELAGENINFAILLAENYALNKEFDKAAGIYFSLISQLTGIVSNELIANLSGNHKKYQLYASYPVMEINKYNTNTDSTIPFRTCRGGIFLDIKHKGIAYNSIFDTGASMNLATEESAKKMELNVLVDSVIINNLPAKIAIADSIYLDSILFTNVPFAILPNNNDFSEISHLLDNSESLFDIVIGNDIMRLLEEVKFDFTKNIMTVPIFNSTGYNKMKNMLYIRNHTYINLNINSNDLMVFYDSGYNGDFIIDENVLDFYPIKSDAKITQRSLTAEGIKKVDLIELDTIEIQINDRKMIVPTSYVGKVEEKEAQALIGKTLLEISDSITINFKDMWIQCE